MLIARWLRAFLARSRAAYTVAHVRHLEEQLADARQKLAEAEASIRVAECENKRLWLLAELHESRIERGMAIQHNATAQLRQAADLVNATRPDELPLSI